MTKQEKNEVIDVLKEKFEQYNNFYITNTESLTVEQVNKLRASGLTAEQAAPRVDLTAFSKDFPQIRGVGADLAGVRRIYKLAQEPEPAQ